MTKPKKAKTPKAPKAPPVEPHPVVPDAVGPGDDREGLAAAAGKVKAVAAGEAAAAELAELPPVVDLIPKHVQEARALAELLMKALSFVTDGLAKATDPRLAEIGVTDPDATFALSVLERAAAHDAFENALLELPPAWLVGGHPFIVLPVTLASIAVPRIIWAAKIRRLKSADSDSEGGPGGSGGDAGLGEDGARPGPGRRAVSAAAGAGA